MPHELTPARRAELQALCERTTATDDSGWTAHGCWQGNQPASGPDGEPSGEPCETCALAQALPALLACVAATEPGATYLAQDVNRLNVANAVLQDRLARVAALAEEWDRKPGSLPNYKWFAHALRDALKGTG